jgi:hypothetical protein
MKEKTKHRAYWRFLTIGIVEKQPDWFQRLTISKQVGKEGSNPKVKI